MQQIFRFRQFSLNQQGCAMKMGTDAMLLGALTNPLDAQNILDIGTGTGVLALMMAQKTKEAIIDAIEPDESMARRAQENFDNSPWQYRLNVYHEPLQTYTNKGLIHYDLVISNPPYFEPSPTTRPDRANARTTTTLTFDALIKNVVELLEANGRFVVILPLQEARQLEAIAQQNGLHLQQNTLISSFAHTPPIRRVMEFIKHPVKNIEETSLYIYNNDKSWSAGYEKLTADFHFIENKE